MATTQTTDDANFITELNETTLLPIMKQDAPFTKVLEEDKFALRSGTDVYFRGRNPIDAVTGTLLAGTELTDPDPVVPTGRKIKASLYRIHNSINASSVERQVSFDGFTMDRDIIAENIIESMELHNLKFIVPYLLHFRADWDITTGTQGYQTRASATAGGTTSTASIGALVEADDWWGGNSTQGYIMPITKNNENYGAGRRIDDFDATGGAAEDLVTIDVSGDPDNVWTDATATGDEFILSIGTDLAAGDKLTIATVAKTMAIMDDLGIKNNFKFANPGGMGFKLFLSAFDFYDITQDTDWKNWAINNAKSDGFKKWSVGNIYSNEILKTDINYRETVAGAFSATGAVYNAIFMGKGAGKRTVLNAPKIKVVNTPDSGNLLGYKTWISYSTDYACCPCVGTAGAAVMTVPTGLL